MKADHPNAKMMREVMERMHEGPEALAEHLTDDVVWHQVGEIEPLRGKQAVLDALRAMTGSVAFAIDWYDVAGDDAVVVSYGRASMSSGDRSTEYDAVEIARMRDGKVFERYAMVGDMEAMERFWSTQGAS